MIRFIVSEISLPPKRELRKRNRDYQLICARMYYKTQRVNNIIT